MSTRYVIVDKGIVVNSILWDGREAYPVAKGTTAIEAPPEVSIGWTLVGKTWVRPDDANEEPDAPSVPDQRQLAYTQEADPLFFKVQRGEATHEEWLAKVEEIRSRFPYDEAETLRTVKKPS